MLTYFNCVDMEIKNAIQKDEWHLKENKKYYFFTNFCLYSVELFPRR